jgi:hypothetical protein
VWEIDVSVELIFILGEDVPFSVDWHQHFYISFLDLLDYLLYKLVWFCPWGRVGELVGAITREEGSS